jgi:hypothetical protein
MGTIGFLWYSMLGWRRRLHPARPGLPEVSLILYATLSLSAISLVLEPVKDKSTTLHLAHSVTTDAARQSQTPLLSLRTGKNMRRSPKLHRRSPVRHKIRSAQTPKANSPTPQAPVPAARYEMLAADPPPAELLKITGLYVSVSSSTARVSWLTNFPATSQGAYAVGETPTLWTSPDPVAVVAHQTTFASLTASTDYTVWVEATDDWGRTADTEVHVRTPPDESQTIGSVSTSGGAIRVNDKPFFPLVLWDVCPSAVSRRINDGINLFMGDGCGNERALLARLRGETFAVTDAANGLPSAPGLIGWYYPDELDGRLQAAPSNAELGGLALNPPPGLITFLTLTNHFYSGADPPPLGRAIYPGLAGLANVLGFDLYPLQNWCRTDRLDAVYRAQRELDVLAGGRPTYQWIEARQMDCPAGALDPTPATVNAETWLAIAGGAEGIGYFPNNWRDEIGAEIRELNARIRALAPALLGEAQDVETNLDAIKVGARTLNGAIYIVAVNSSSVQVDASIHAAGLAGRAVGVLDEGRQLAVSDADMFTDTFGPLGVHIYVAAPSGWNTAPASP